ncbi:MAG: IS110 family transposase [Caulobacteraceae bacterium]|nr:IS110 family transposase [Caulobacteraceae bacterium]
MVAQAPLVVGIDVSKRKLDWCIRGQERGCAANTPPACTALAETLRQRGVCMAVVEASGGYEATVVSAFRAAGVVAWVVDPKRVRDFAKSAGRRAKNDAIDADVIAWFAETFGKGQSAPTPDVPREELAALVAERQGFVALSIQLKNRDEHPGSAAVARERRAIVKQIARAVARLEAAITRKIAHTPHLAEAARVLTSVPGIGDLTAAALIAWLPELGRIDRRKLSALVGVAPYDNDSGNQKGARHIAGGRFNLRTALYMPTVGAATQHNPVLRDYYAHLLATGKVEKVALVACMRKLLGILNTMMARHETWSPRQSAPAVA